MCWLEFSIDLGCDQGHAMITTYCLSLTPSFQFLRVENNLLWRCLITVPKDKSLCFCTVLSDILGLVQLMDELIDVVNLIPRWAHPLKEAHSILGSVTGHREVERTQESGDLLELLPRGGYFMNEVFQANDTKLPQVLFNQCCLSKRWSYS
jgi:hypothetical protein